MCLDQPAQINILEVKGSISIILFVRLALQHTFQKNPTPFETVH